MTPRKNAAKTAGTILSIHIQLVIPEAFMLSNSFANVWKGSEFSISSKTRSFARKVPGKS